MSLNCYNLQVFMLSSQILITFLLKMYVKVVAVASLPKEIAAGLHPKQNNAIRGLLLQSGWVVEKLEDDSCMVTYVVQVFIHVISRLCRIIHETFEIMQEYTRKIFFWLLLLYIWPIYINFVVFFWEVSKVDIEMYLWLLYYYLCS